MFPEDMRTQLARAQLALAHSHQSTLLTFHEYLMWDGAGDLLEVLQPKASQISAVTHINLIFWASGFV